MTIKRNIMDKLELLNNYDCDDETKIKFIECLYKVANLSFDNYVKRFDKIKL